MTGKLFAIDIAAVATDVQPQRIRRWVREGKLKAVTHNRRSYVRTEDVEALRDAPSISKVRSILDG